MGWLGTFLYMFSTLFLSLSWMHRVTELRNHAICCSQHPLSTSRIINHVLCIIFFQNAIENDMYGYARLGWLGTMYENCFIPSIKLQKRVWLERMKWIPVYLSRHVFREDGGMEGFMGSRPLVLSTFFFFLQMRRWLTNNYVLNCSNYLLQLHHKPNNSTSCCH